MGADGEIPEEKKGVDEWKGIVGKWQLTKRAGENAPRGCSLELTGDGKVNVTVIAADRMVSEQGTYKVTGNKIKIMLTPINGENRRYEETLEIKRLTRRELVVIAGDGKEEVYKRK
jgi:uncharacterized protein (TIGR03066 family)